MNLVKKTILAAIAAAATVGPQAASAQTPSTYDFSGSDTLFDIVSNATKPSATNTNLDLSKLPSGWTSWADVKQVPGSLNYKGGGSGTAESAMTAVPPGQFIGPMSRNFKSTVLAAHPSWAPDVPNVVGLDAAVIVRNAATICSNLNIALDPADPTKAVVDNDLALILGGKGGTGTFAACSHPDRLAALARLAQCLGVSSINHIYRRDDNSGTTDTMKERLQIGRFCNGAAAGVNGTNKTDPNLNNQDIDPIRTTCVAASAAYSPTACTNGTQGLVVALSEADPGFSVTDITTTIGHRAALDPASIGYAGRESVTVSGSAPTSLNSINPMINDNVRTATYFLSRRLYLQKNTEAVDPADPFSRYDTENDFFTWATDENFTVYPEPGRCHLDPLVTYFGFVTCSDDCWSRPSDASNICVQTPFAGAPTFPAACILNGSPAGTGVCCSGAAPDSSGVCQPATLAAGYYCSANSSCTSGSCNTSTKTCN